MKEAHEGFLEGQNVLGRCVPYNNEAAHLFYALFSMWVTVHNKKTFKNITCPNSVVFPLKEKNMALQSL